MEEYYKNLSLEDIEGEVWKPIKDYEGYLISSKGRIKSLPKKKGSGNGYFTSESIRIQKKQRSGYLEVNLIKDRRQRFFLVHRLVAKAFMPNPYNLPCINHRDENKHNNCVENLEWCTAKYNSNYGTLKERQVEIQRRSNRYKKPILQYGLDGQFIREWSGIYEVHDTLGYDKYNLYNACLHKSSNYTAYGFFWKFKGDDFEISPYINPRFKPVLCYTKELVLVGEYPSIIEASVALGIPKRGISACCVGIHKSSGGYIWRHKEETLNK